MSRFVVAISPEHMDPDYALEREGLGPDVELRPWRARTQEDLAQEIAGADAVLTWRFRVDAPVIEALERCKVIVRMGVGFDVVDAAAAARRGIPVCNVPDYCTSEVADHTLGLLLALTRRIPAYTQGLQRGNEAWRWDAAGPVHRITGRTLGIVGLGRIGTAVALRAKAFGLRVVFTDPYVRDGVDRALGLERLELGELLAQADYVSLHTPLTDQTRGLAGERFFSQVKPGMMLVNTSRGPVVDLGALESAMRAGVVAMAGLDVLPAEPPVPEPGLLRAWRADEEWVRGRLVLSPHAAFFSEEADHDMRVKAAQTVREVLEGKPVRNQVN